MRVEINFLTKVNRKSTFYPHGHFRTMKTKWYNIPKALHLNQTLTIDEIKYRIVKESHQYNRGKGGHDIYGVVKWD